MRPLLAAIVVLLLTSFASANSGYRYRVCGPEGCQEIQRLRQTPSRVIVVGDYAGREVRYQWHRPLRRPMMRLGRPFVRFFRR